MEKLIAELCDILELADLPLDVPFEDLPEWDSLNALSVIALLESNYAVHMDAAGLQKFGCFNELVRHVLQNKN